MHDTRALESRIFFGASVVVTAFFCIVVGQSGFIPCWFVFVRVCVYECEWFFILREKSPVAILFVFELALFAALFMHTIQFNLSLVINKTMSTAEKYALISFALPRINNEHERAMRQEMMTWNH